MTCSVCGAQVGAGHGDFAMVGANERLCMVNGEKSAGCFAWFSGYPWVLFEMGSLVSNLRTCMYATIYDPPYGIEGECDHAH